MIYLQGMNFLVVQLLKSWEYKNVNFSGMLRNAVVQLLKSWEYKNLGNKQAR